MVVLRDEGGHLDGAGDDTGVMGTSVFTFSFLIKAFGCSFSSSVLGKENTCSKLETEDNGGNDGESKMKLRSMSGVVVPSISCRLLVAMMHRRMT